jgi:two-component system OmpR family sensor kinase
LWNKLKHSLIVQFSFLFFISLLIIVVLWIVSYQKQLREIREHNINRYIRTVEYFQPILFRLEQVTQEQLDAFAMQLYDDALPQTPYFQGGSDKVGFRIYKHNDQKILHIYNPIEQITLLDVAQQKQLTPLHTVFSVLLLLQLLLFLVMRRILFPLSMLKKKLQSLRTGDLSLLENGSGYEEIAQITSSYNAAVQKLESLLTMREMFNKIFMHELKTPIAKGLFYLKMPPSLENNEKLNKLFYKINDEIDDFVRIESLIAQDAIQKEEETLLISLLRQALKKLDIQNENNVIIQGCDEMMLRGDASLWVLCFKNIIDNALKYSEDAKVTVTCEKGAVIFCNRGEALPVDVNKPQSGWKLSPHNRHKSSTGYGFGLFIITSIVKMQNYELAYKYDTNRRKLTLKIFN